MSLVDRLPVRPLTKLVLFSESERVKNPSHAAGPQRLPKLLTAGLLRDDVPAVIGPRKTVRPSLCAAMDGWKV